MFKRLASEERENGKVGWKIWWRLIVQLGTYIVTIVENTHLFHKGKYYYIAGLLFHWLGFDQTCKTIVNLN